MLLFRLGDFYELFERDAERGAAMLGITLTKRHEMPMAGIPFHAAEGYLTKLLNAGHKVAICDQLETAQTEVSQARDHSNFDLRDRIGR